MKAFFQKKDNQILLAIIFLLGLFASWQESQIADLQERMMNIESSKYDDQLTNLYWHAGTVDEKLKEMDKDIYHLQKKSTSHEWRIMDMEWER